MADIVEITVIASYVTGMILMSEAFLKTASVMDMFAKKSRMNASVLVGTVIPKHRFAIVVGSSGFLILALLVIYAQVVRGTREPGFFKSIGTAITLAGSLLMLYGVHGFLKRLRGRNG